MAEVIEVLDSLMGSGKTTQVIKWMEEHHEEKYIYVSPLLSEVGDGGRLSQAVSRISFSYPTTEDHDTKSEHLLELLSNGENIACTHSLYMSLTNEHLDLVEYHGYTVVIDEEINVIEGFDKYSIDDYKWLYSNEKVSVDPHDGMLSWVCDQPVGKAHKYYMLKQYCDSQCLYVAKRSNVMMVTQLPIRLMTVAKRVVILTYMFEGNILDRFLKLKGVESKPFEEVQVVDVSKDSIRDLIELVEPKVDLSISTGLSSSWYKRASQAQLDVVGKYIRSVAMKYKATPDDLMYTIPKERHVGSKNLVKPKGYYRKRNEDGSWSYCWLPVQTRATNDYADKSVLVHCYDRYPMVSVESYLQDYGYPISREVFALSEMLQWVWRSRIRKGEKIVLAIASKRMYSLFKDWLNKD